MAENESTRASDMAEGLAELARLRGIEAAARELQWCIPDYHPSNVGYRLVWRCPSCKALKPKHAADCKLAAALAGGAS